MRNGAELVALGCGVLLASAIGGRSTLALAGGSPWASPLPDWRSTGASEGALGEPRTASALRSVL
jgi:hypothetical protein